MDVGEGKGVDVEVDVGVGFNVGVGMGVGLVQEVASRMNSRVKASIGLIESYPMDMVLGRRVYPYPILAGLAEGSIWVVVLGSGGCSMIKSSRAPCNIER